MKQKESYITYAAILHVDLYRAILHISMTAYYITAYKRQWNLRAPLRRKNIKCFFKKVTKRGIIRNKKFCSFIKPFLTNKGFLENKDNTLIEWNEIITSERGIAKNFNEHYLNTIEKISGIKPKSETKIRIFIKQLGKLSNLMRTILANS